MERFSQTPEEKQEYDDFIYKIDQILSHKPKYIVIHPLDLAKWTVRKFNCYPSEEEPTKSGQTTFLCTTDIPRGELVIQCQIPKEFTKEYFEDTDLKY